MLDKLDIEKWLELNAKLQQKKNALRKTLKKKGILKKEGHNESDKYKYFSEAQYKELFTELFSQNGLEIKFSEIEYNTFEGSGRDVNGRMLKLEFYLFDIDTGFYETTVITGEGVDKGDKAGYTAYTGALKYYLADTFMVATGDDAEKKSPEHKMNEIANKKASSKQLTLLRNVYTGEKLEKLLEANNLKKLEDISKDKASELIEKLKERNKENGKNKANTGDDSRENNDGEHQS